jgi:hypothetical protein
MPVKVPQDQLQRPYEASLVRKSQSPYNTSAARKLMDATSSEGEAESHEMLAQAAALRHRITQTHQDMIDRRLV